MKCEWCKMNYPDGAWNCFYNLSLFGKKRHIICSNCYYNLIKVIYKKDLIPILSQQKNKEER